MPEELPFYNGREFRLSISYPQGGQVMKKLIKRVVLVLVILIVLAVVAVWLFLDPIAKSAVQSGASDTLYSSLTLRFGSGDPVPALR